MRLLFSILVVLFSSNCNISQSFSTIHSIPYIRPMKFFAFIFAFYILSISTMPCNDVHDGAKSSISTVEQAQDHHESDNDICSPFCICSCCQGFVAMTSFADITPVTFTFTTGFAHYTEKFFSSSFAAIWQPPRLG